MFYFPGILKFHYISVTLKTKIIKKVQYELHPNEFILSEYIFVSRGYCTTLMTPHPGGDSYFSMPVTHEPIY